MFIICKFGSIDYTIVRGSIVNEAVIVGEVVSDHGGGFTVGTYQGKYIGRDPVTNLMIYQVTQAVD